MIKNLIFDFGKVLVNYDFGVVVSTFFDDPHELEAFMQTIVSSDFVDKCDKEDIPFYDIISNAKRQYPQWERQLQMFYDHYIDFVIGEVPEMRDLLIRYRSMGYKLYGLTNWCSVVHQVIEKYDILQLLDGRVISSEEHLIKPDPAIYQCLLDRFNLIPEECVFADDKPVNITGAKSVGMNAILFHDAQQYEKELQRILSTSNVNL